MQAKINHINNLSKQVGLKIHPQKSKILKVGKVADNNVMLENVEHEKVEEFTYLGSIIDKRGGSEADIKARIGKARIAFSQLQKVWKASKISLQTKLRLFNSNVKSVLMYGCETWKTTKGIVRKIQTFVNGCLRKIFKIIWTDKIKNEDLWKRMGQAQMEQQIGQRKWRWIVHTLRKPQNCTTRQALQWNP